MYQVGQASHPHDNDPRFDTEAEALQAARLAADGDAVYAVWKWADEFDADTLYLVYQNDVWRKA